MTGRIPSGFGKVKGGVDFCLMAGALPRWGKNSPFLSKKKKGGKVSPAPIMPARGRAKTGWRASLKVRKKVSGCRWRIEEAVSPGGKKRGRKKGNGKNLGRERAARGRGERPLFVGCEKRKNCLGI